MVKVWHYCSTSDQDSDLGSYTEDIEAFDAESVGLILDLIDRHKSGELLPSEERLLDNKYFLLTTGPKEERVAIIARRLSRQSGHYVALCALRTQTTPVTDSIMALAHRRFVALRESGSSYTNT